MASVKALFYVCACVCVSLAVTTAEVVTVPLNVAVLRGSTATFQCIIDAPKVDVCWLRETGSTETQNYLYGEGELMSLCNNGKCNVTFDDESNSHTLMINSVQHHDAGLYACRICHTADEYAAQLIVLQTGEPVGAFISLSSQLIQAYLILSDFWPTVLSVVSLVLLCRLSVVCLSVTFCIVAKRYNPPEK